MRSSLAACRRGVAATVVAFLCAAGLCLPVDAVAQESASRPVETFRYEFGSSTVPMIRNAEFFTASAAITDRVAEIVLDKAGPSLFQEPSRRGVLGRICKLYFVDMPIASLAQVLNHEYGHITRDAQIGPHSVYLERWPWPVPFASPRIRSPDARPLTDLQALANIAGGSEASHVLADHLADRAYASDRASYFDLLLYVYGKLDASAYAIVVGRWNPGDPEMYAETLARVRQSPVPATSRDVDALFGSIRTGAWLNLLDYALIGNVHGVVTHYLIRGQRMMRPAWIHAAGLRFVPGFDYIPTPRGQQYRINCRIGVRAQVLDVNVRWTQALHADAMFSQAASNTGAFQGNSPRFRLVGLGGRWQGDMNRRMGLTVTADVWRDVSAQPGGRAELGLTCRSCGFGERRGLNIAVGAKSGGYVPGFPLQHALYISAALLAEF